MNERFYESKGKPSATERVWKFGRDLNFVEAVAIGGIALAIPGPNQFLAAWAALNGAQAVGFEALRRNAKKKRYRGEYNDRKAISRASIKGVA